MAGFTVLETNARGELRIPTGLLGAGPRVRFRVEQEGQALRLVPESSASTWHLRSPAERARAFHDWVVRLPKRSGPAIPADALRREDLYD